MAAHFGLAVYPWTYRAKADAEGNWTEEWREGPHLTPAEEDALSDEERAGYLAERNAAGSLPLCNYTTQYGFGVFEGLKAFPHPDGKLRLFRPDRNAARMHRGMGGMLMPQLPEAMFVDAAVSIVQRNAQLGFRVDYDRAWEDGDFVEGGAVYLRPFTLAEGGVGLNLSKMPWVIMIATPVGSYFDPDARPRAVTSNMIRATENGTGWIKCDANYVISTLAKKRVQAEGYMEAIFLDGKHRRFVEEGSSSNVFFVMKNGTLVTPSLEDRVLEGITRDSAIVLARDAGITVEERPIEIGEVLSNAVEGFLTGTAAGVMFLESVTHEGVTNTFGNGKIGEVAGMLRKRLRGIQYGAEADVHGWLVEAT